MMETFISARLLQPLSDHRHGKQPSHNSTVGGWGLWGEEGVADVSASLNN